MIHLIYTSVPLSQIPEIDRYRLEDAVAHWGRNHSFSENDANPNFQISKVRDPKGEMRLEWRRIYNRVLHIPSVLDECSLFFSGFPSWFKYVEFVAVATDVQFRKNGVSRFSAYDDKSKSSIHELRYEDGLNRLQLFIVRSLDPGQSFADIIKWFQGYVVFFLETAAIYQLASQAMMLNWGSCDSSVATAVRKKLERIQQICNLDYAWTRSNEQE